MEISFAGKRALVTGAAQGIGLAVVKKLWSCGAKVVALDIQEEKLLEAVKELSGVETVVVNLRDWDSIERSLKSIGGVELVVNNAGVFSGQQVHEITEDETNKVLDVNLKPVMAVCKHVINDWISAGVKGAIVNIASVAATRPSASFPVYCASKAGVVQYTRCLALDCAPRGIRVNAISPGLVDTEMGRTGADIPEVKDFIARAIPMPEKFLDPEDIANAVAFLLCDKVARRITGVDLNVDAGYMLS